MPPVLAGIGAAVGAFSGAFAGLGAGAAGAGLFASAFQQIAVGIGMTALGQALAPKAGSPGSQRPAGMRLTADVGETGPQAFMMGRGATAGELVFHGSYGHTEGNKTPNKTYVQVFELSDLPLTGVRRYWINGEWAELEATTYQDLGHPVKGYRLNGTDRLWVKFYDGNQVAADPQLVANFPPSYAQPWTAASVGRGIAYMVVTAYFAPEVHAQRPKVLVEVDGIALYDPRRDSTVGGAGSQRLGNRATWTFSANPKVMEYNILLGIHDPVTGKHLWGGQGIRQQDLPAGEWFAAMNECDRVVAGKPNYTAGIEVRVNEEPATVCEELNRCCQGVTVEVSGTWHTRAGPPGPPVYFFTDADVVVTSPDTFTPFPQSSESYNGVRAQHPDPALGWQIRDAPPLDSVQYLAEDKGRVNVAALQYRAVYDRAQVQRLKAAALKDSRRWRRHALVLPPEARALTPVDTVAWTSARNGYSAKLFEMPMIEDLENGNAALGLREWDPTDYDYDEVDIPGDDGFTGKPPRVPIQGDFAVVASTILDANGIDRAPAIDLLWDRTVDNVDAVRYRVRLAATHAHIPAAGQASVPDGGETVSGFMQLNGVPARLNAQPVTYTVFTDVAEGKLTISEGIKSLTEYEVQAVYSPTMGREWSVWMPVTTLDVRLTELDFADEVNQVIHDARDRAQEAAADVIAMQAQLNAISDLVDGLSSEVLDRADAILAALAGFDTDAILELTGLAVAGMRKGDFVADPTFRDWTGANLTNWTGVGVSTFGTKVISGTPPPTYGTALRLAVPAGAGVASIIAASDVAGQMPNADPAAEWLMLSVLLRTFSGSLAGAQLRVEWRATGSTGWTRGHAFGVNNSLGRAVEDYGFAVDATRFQSRETIWRRPVASAAAVRVVAIAKQAAPALAVDLRFDYLGLTRASDAEVAGFNAYGLATTEIESLRTEIVGPTGALAALQDSIEAEFGPAVALVTGGAFALATDVTAMAGEIDSLAVSFGDPNLVRNPAFTDGVRASGVQPQFWSSWPAGFSVIARDPADAAGAIRNAPTQFFGRVAGDGAQYQAIAFDDVPVTPEDVLSISGAFATGAFVTSTTATMEARFEFRAEPGAAALSPTVVRSVTTSVIQGWVRPVWEPVEVPTGAALARLIIRRVAGGGGSGVSYFTQIDCRKGDPVSAAEITVLKSVKVDAAGAVAAMEISLGAEFESETGSPNYSAFVTQNMAAIATGKLAASTYTIRATAGAGSAGLRLVAFDDEDGSGGGVLIDAPYLIQPGTISAGELVITDHGYNLIADSELQAPTYWSNEAQFLIIKATTNDDSDSEGELRFVGTAPGVSIGDPFPVRAGQVLTCSAQIGRINGTTHTASAKIRFTERDGTVVSTVTIGAVTAETSPVAISVENKITVPANARLAQFRWDVDATNGNPRFFAPSVIKRERGSSLITPDGAFFESLTAQTAWIGEANIIDLSVSTIKIKGGALGRIIDATRNADFSVNAGWTDVITITLPAGMLPGGGATAKALICPATNFTTTAAGQRTVGMRVLINGASIWAEEYEYGTSTDQRSQSFVIVSTVGNSDVIKWQLRRAAGTANVDHVKTYLSVINLFQVS